MVQLGLHGITFTEGTEEGIDAPFLFEILEVNEQLNEATTDAEIEEIGNLVQGYFYFIFLTVTYTTYYFIVQLNSL